MIQSIKSFLQVNKDLFSFQPAVHTFQQEWAIQDVTISFLSNKPEHQFFNPPNVRAWKSIKLIHKNISEIHGGKMV